MSTDATNLAASPAISRAASSRDVEEGRPWDCRLDAAYESRRAHNYPVARWYLRPAAARLAALLAPTRVRPVHLTLCGLAAAAAAAAVLLWKAEATPIAAALVLAYWFFDRADGLLARRQRTVSAWGAWLDANVDELVDVGLHVATAAVIASQVAATWPWLLLIGFLAGKYLLFYGLDEKRGHSTFVDDGTASQEQRQTTSPRLTQVALHARADGSLVRRAYHLPGNADVRVHLLAVALATGWLAAELMLVAAYYNMRWMVRYVLVARRLRGAP